MGDSIAGRPATPARLDQVATRSREIVTPDTVLKRSVAFLRAINVGGRRATSDRLTAALEGLGLTGVETFLASGNVLYEPDPSVGDSAMEEAMRATLGFSVEVTSRSAAELGALAEARPFSEDATAASTGSPQVMLLFGPVTPAMRAAVEATDTEDAFVFGGRELHWLPRAGVSDSDLRPIHRAVGPNTIRSARTIVRLVERL